MREPALWLVEDRPERAARMLELAVALQAGRLELARGAWTPESLESARAHGLEPLETDGRDSFPVGGASPLPRPRLPETFPWAGSGPGLRRFAEGEFAASAPGRPFVSAPGRLAAGLGPEALAADLRMRLAGILVAGGPGIRIGPWPGWEEFDLLAAGTPMAAELTRFLRLRDALGPGEAREDPVVLLEPDEPDDGELSRIFEAWLLLRLAGVRPRRVAAREASRKLLNAARLVVVPGCWSFPEDRWVTLGGWVRGGGNLWLGFDERAVSAGFPAGIGPPGPGFLARLVGRTPAGVPAPARSGEAPRLRFRRGRDEFSDLSEVDLPGRVPFTPWSLAPVPVPEGKRGRDARAGTARIDALASAERVDPALWSFPLDRGVVYASALPLEAMLARSPDAYEPGSGPKGRATGLELARLTRALLKTLGLVEGPPSLEPDMFLTVFTAKGGFAQSALVLNRGRERAPGRLAVPGLPDLQALDLESRTPVDLRQGRLVVPTGPLDLRAIGFDLRR